MGPRRQGWSQNALENSASPMLSSGRQFGEKLIAFPRVAARSPVMAAETMADRS